MICTRCSDRVLPVVAVDIDGTLANYHDAFHEFAARYLGVPLISRVPYLGDRRHREWFCDQAGVDVRTFRDIKLAYRQGAHKRFQPLYPGATRIMIELSRRAEVWITTTRPFNRLDNIDPDTRFWLDRNGIPYHYMLAGDEKYEELASRVESSRVVAVIDDLPEQYDEAARLFGPDVPLLISRPHNGKVGGKRQFTFSLTSACEHSVRCIERWRNGQSE